MGEIAKKARAKRKPTPAETYLAIATMVAILMIGSAIIGIDIKVLLIACSAINLLLAYRCGYGWSDVETTFSRKISEMSGALLIIIAIGFVIGSWMVSGTVPALAYWLSSVIAVDFILPCAFILTGIMSCLIGSSFAVMGTLGIVLFNTAVAQGIDPGMAAAVVICGSNVGQFTSPLADVSSAISGFNRLTVYEHLHQLRKPVILACIISVVAYFVIGTTMGGGSSDLAAAGALREEIAQFFNLNPLVVLPLVLAIGMCILKMPPALALFASGFVAIVVAMGIQGVPFVDAAMCAWSGYDVTVMLPDAHMSEMLFGFLNRGGAVSMADGVMFILVAMATVSVLETIGIFDVIQETALRGAKTIRSLTVSTSLFSALFTCVTCDSYTTNAVAATSLRGAYIKAGYNPKTIDMLAISWAFMVEQILPWTFIAVYSGSVYGVEVLAYAPGCIFYFAMCLIVTVMPFIGLGYEKIDENFVDETTAEETEG